MAFFGPSRNNPYLFLLLLPGASALDALSIGYRTILIDDCSRGVDLNDIEKTKQTVMSSSGVIVNSNQVSELSDNCTIYNGKQ